MFIFTKLGYFQSLGKERENACIPQVQRSHSLAGRVPAMARIIFQLFEPVHAKSVWRHVYDRPQKITDRLNHAVQGIVLTKRFVPRIFFENNKTRIACIRRNVVLRSL